MTQHPQLLNKNILMSAWPAQPLTRGSMQPCRAMAVAQKALADNQDLGAQLQAAQQDLAVAQDRCARTNEIEGELVS